MPASPLLAMSDFLDPRSGPGQSGSFEISPTFFVVLFALGFLIGTLGHVIKSRMLVAVGVLCVFLATVLLPVAVTLSN